MQQGPVALVTGGSRGIGQAICVDLAHHGFIVVPTARSVSQSVEQWGGTVNETAERVRALGREALPDLPLPRQGMPGMVVPVSRGATERLAPALRREAACTA